MATDIAWFRRDARLRDNPAWSAAAEADTVVPLFVIDPKLYEHVSDRRRAYLLGGLRDLDLSLQALGGRLRVEHGDPRSVVPRVARSVGASRVHVNLEVSPGGSGRDRSVSETVDLAVHPGTYVHPPGSIRTRSGHVYKVFTPFYRAWSQRPLPLADVAPVARVSGDVGSGLPGEGHDGTGETSALRRLSRFVERADRYWSERDRPDLEGTSRLSIDLKYGWVSPAEVIRQAEVGTSSPEPFIRQVAWRDFYGHILHVAPESVDHSLRTEYRAIDWEEDPEALEAWKSGRTGYPIVDAGMRQLHAEGWIHNRIRMVCASFLVKDLLIDWREGERWFRRELLDADVAQNVGNWQWVAGTGTDAAPYFRVLNPVLQSKKVDPKGAYIRRWVPEIAAVPNRWIHAPWEMGPLELETMDVKLGETYPFPIVEHAEARSRALVTYRKAREDALAASTE